MIQKKTMNGLMLLVNQNIAKAILLSLCLLLGSCYPGMKKEATVPSEALEQITFFYPTFSDDMDRDSLLAAIENSIEYLNRLPADRILHYGPHSFTSRQVLDSQKAFLQFLQENPNPSQVNKKIEEDFLVYRATGGKKSDNVLFTGYFEPLYEASLIPDSVYRYPLYRKPDDLTTLDLSGFGSRFKGQKIIGRMVGKGFVPYYTKVDIDEKGVLKGRGLEIAWLKDPIDVAFLQIQGSGKLTLRDGSTISAGYSAKNGLPYKSIGRYMIDEGFLTKKEMSMQAIRSCLAKHPKIVRDVLSYNLSYVFFRRLKKGPLGNIGVQLTPGRSIATDSKLFPKGALGFITCKKPTIDSAGMVTGWKEFSRFVLNQDTGGAIRGAGRADIFWGSGLYAEAAAGHQNHEGELYILIKKP